AMRAPACVGGGLPAPRGPADVLTHDVEQAARLFGGEVLVDPDAEDPLAGPVPALRPVARMDDDALERRPPHQFVDELLGAEELQLTRLLAHHCPRNPAGARTSSPHASLPLLPGSGPVGRSPILAACAARCERTHDVVSPRRPIGRPGSPPRPAASARA